MDPSAICYCGAARGEARREVRSAVRLPIAALLVGLGWGTLAAAQPAPAPAPASDLYVHTIAPRDTLIALSRTLLAEPRRWTLLQRLNRVRNPRRLKPGRTLRIPIDLLRTIPASAEVLWVRGAPRVQLVDGTNAVALIGAMIGEGARLTTQGGGAAVVDAEPKRRAADRGGDDRRADLVALAGGASRRHGVLDSPTPQIDSGAGHVGGGNAAQHVEPHVGAFADRDRRAGREAQPGGLAGLRRQAGALADHRPDQGHGVGAVDEPDPRTAPHPEHLGPGRYGAQQVDRDAQRLAGLEPARIPDAVEALQQGPAARLGLERA